MRRVLFLVLLAAATPAFGQSLDPRSFVNTPVGINFASLAYGFSTGNVLFDAALALENAELDIHGPTAGYARALDLWGLSGKLDAALGGACIDGQAEQNGDIVTRNVCGLTDPTAHISINFLGAPALTLRQFPTYRQNFLVGAGFRVTAPLGQYDPSRLVNIGTNRWSFKPELAVSKAIGRLTLEALFAATFFTDNTDFLDGNTQSQAGLYSGQLNALWISRSGIWGGVGVIYYAGGESSLNGGTPSTMQENSRAGAVLVFPIGKPNSLKLYWTTGVWTRTGTDFDTFVVTWTYRWGGKR